MNRMLSDKKNIAIGLLGFALIICLWFLFQANPQPPYDETLINTRINTLEQENSQLQNDINRERLKSAEFMAKIDSLRNQPPIIQYKYVKIYEKIDSSSVIDVVNEFDSIFTANGIY